MNQATYSEFRFARQIRAEEATGASRRERLHDAIANLMLYRVMILIIASLGVIAGAAFSIIQAPVFSATAEIVLSPASQGRASQGFGQQDLETSFVRSEMHVVSSISVATRLVDKVGLAQAQRWTTRPLSPLMASILPQRSAAAPDVLTVAREIRKALSVSRKDSTLVIMLTASAATPADAAAIANGLAAAYTEARADGRSDAARDASARLQDRLARLKADAEAKASEVEAYRARVIAMAAGGGVSTPEAPPPISSRDALKLRDLQRQADASLDVYNQYLAQSSDARAAGAPGAAALARIVSPAAPPQRPSSAPAWIWPLVGGAAACLMGLLLAALRTALDNRLVRPSDVQRKLGQEALVSIPTVNDSELRHFSPDERFPASLIVAKPMSRLAERMRMLLSRLAPLSINGHGLVVAVTSAVADEGKTTTALSLGRVASMGGQRVLMIEGDLRMRSLSELVGATSGGVDMIAALAGDTDWRSALFLDPATQAHILPVSTAFPMLGNTFASPRMLRILEEARAEYDLVILDCPPVLAIADARSLCSIADGTLVVSAWNDTPAPAVRAAIRAIQATGGGVIGVILNRLQPSLASRLSYGDALYEGPSSERYFAG